MCLVLLQRHPVPARRLLLVVLVRGVADARAEVVASGRILGAHWASRFFGCPAIVVNCDRVHHPAAPILSILDQRIPEIVVQSRVYLAHCDVS